MEMSSGDRSGLGTWLSRGALAVCGLGVIVGGVATTSIARTLWTAAAGTDFQAYGSALATHGAVLRGVLSPTAAMAVIVPLVISAKAPRSHVPMVLAAVGMLTWMIAWLLPALHTDGGWEFDPSPFGWAHVSVWCGVASLVAFGAALGITAIAEVRTTPATRSLTTAAWAVTAWLAATFTALGILGGHPIPASLLAGLFTETLFWGLLVSVALAAVAMAMLEDMRVVSPAIAFVALGVFPAFIGERLLGRFLAFVEVDVHLHDTYFEVGREHLAMGGAAAAMLAALHLFDVRLLGRKARAWLAWPGAVLFCGGMLAQSIAMMVLGSRGMPRRYAVYPVEFADAHQLVIQCGMVVGAGAVLVIAAWVFGARRSIESS